MVYFNIMDIGLTSHWFDIFPGKLGLEAGIRLFFAKEAPVYFRDGLNKSATAVSEFRFVIIITKVVLQDICNLWVFSSDLVQKVLHDHAGRVKT